MKILLDTNFIVTSVKQKLDFANLADELFDEPLEWIVPQDVLNELGNIKDKAGNKKEDKNAAKLSFDILQTINPKIVELPGKSKNIDIKIVIYILNTDIVLATLDKALKNRINNKILTIRKMKSLELI